jgi:hypothetical protein
MSGVEDQPPQTQVTNTKPEEDSVSHTTDYAPYPKLDPNDVVPPPPQPQPAASTDAAAAATTMPAESNPYVSPAPVSAPTSTKSLFSLFLPSIFYPIQLLLLFISCSSNLFYYSFILCRYFRFGQRCSWKMGKESC